MGAGEAAELTVTRPRCPGGGSSWLGALPCSHLPFSFLVSVPAHNTPVRYSPTVMDCAASGPHGSQGREHGTVGLMDTAVQAGSGNLFDSSGPFWHPSLQ